MALGYLDTCTIVPPINVSYYTRTVVLAAVVLHTTILRMETVLGRPMATRIVPIISALGLGAMGDLLTLKLIYKWVGRYALAATFPIGRASTLLSGWIFYIFILVMCTIFFVLGHRMSGAEDTCVLCIAVAINMMWSW